MYLVRDINSPIPQFTNPRFFYRHIYWFFFWIEIIKPFLNLEWALTWISQHHSNNNNTKFRSKNIRELVKINWWIDVTNKIVSLFRWCSLHTCFLSNKFPPIFIFVSENEYRGFLLSETTLEGGGGWGGFSCSRILGFRQENRKRNRRNVYYYVIATPGIKILTWSLNYVIVLTRLTWLIHTSVLPSNWNLGKIFALIC